MVQGNLIGTDDFGKAPIPNGQFGVAIIDTASYSLIGGTGKTAAISGQGNLISGNGLGGVDFRNGAGFNQVQGSFIGTSVTGGGKLGNGGNGVTLESGAFSNSLGGPGLGNVISANNGDGVEITDSGTKSNVLEDNRIGTNGSASAALGNTAEGVLIANGASDNTVGGLSGATSPLPVDNVISGNKANGVAITGKGTTGNVVEGNLIGTDASVKKALPNGRDGVVLTHDAASNIVGGSDPRAGNLISGNKESGVLINHSATASTVQNNAIGVGAAGAVALANGQDGIDLLSSGDSVLGNLVSGNQGSGLVLEGSQDLIQGNRIGTDVTGSFSIANQHDGVLLVLLIGPGGNTVGGTARGAGNLISGNGWNGIEIGGPTSAGNLIEGNDIGTDAPGQKAVANTRDGILVKNTTGYAIGGASPFAGNVISGNGQDGVEITGGHSSGLTLQGNRIGTNFTGQAAVPNQGNGVHIHDGASKNTVGGSGGAAGNVISGNVGDGVLIAVADANVISANRIGTNFNGSAALANQGNGVHIVHAGGNTVGGGAPFRNLISGNTHDGVLIASASDDNVVSGDWIGTDASGTKALQNGGDGVDLMQAAVRNTVGGIPSTSNQAPGNVISGNHGSGVVITGDGTDQNLVEGNYIGTTPSGAAALGNLGDGVDVLKNASNNQIGGQGGVGPGGAGNLISANAGDGVQIANANSNALQGNWIGTDVTGQLPLGNAGHGVFVAHGATNDSIGGAPPAGGNVIAYNAKAGVAVVDVATLHDPILSNSIFGNGGLGIDLGDNGVTPNTSPSPKVGPNELQNFPVFPPGGVVAGSSILMSLNSIPNSSFTIQLFSNPVPDPTGHGQGKSLVVTLTITTGASGNGSIVWNVPASLKGLYLSATATDPLGDTSEFSQDVKVT
jgi:titin